MNTTLPGLGGMASVSVVLFALPGVSELVSRGVDGAALFVLTFISTTSGLTLEPWTITVGCDRSSETAKLLSELPLASEGRLDSVKWLFGVLFIPRSSMMDTSSDHRSLLGWPVTA